jgi:hypothetical protein
MALETISWNELEPEFIGSWGRPNGKVEAEHISIVGPTGSGKSMFQTYVANKRAEARGSNVMIIATKPADSTLKGMKWPIVSSWPPEYGKHEQFILWPKGGRDERQARINQHSMIREALTDIWRENAHTIVVFDEIAYIEQELKLKVLIERYWREGRSIGISIVATTQRPRNVTRYMWSEATWLVAFPPSDEDEASRVAEIIGGRKKYTEQLMELKRHQFILINRREKEAYISKLGT